jgi:hypothetical protein
VVATNSDLPLWLLELFHSPKSEKIRERRRQARRRIQRLEYGLAKSTDATNSLLEKQTSRDTNGQPNSILYQDCTSSIPREIDALLTGYLAHVPSVMLRLLV